MKIFDKMLIALAERLPIILPVLLAKFWDRLCEAYCARIRDQLIERFNDPNDEKIVDDLIIDTLDSLFGCTGDA